MAQKSWKKILDIFGLWGQGTEKFSGKKGVVFKIGFGVSFAMRK